MYVMIAQRLFPHDHWDFLDPMTHTIAAMFTIIPPPELLISISIIFVKFEKSIFLEQNNFHKTIK